jgi:hypothetical protein
VCQVALRRIIRRERIPVTRPHGLPLATGILKHGLVHMAQQAPPFGVISAFLVV